MTSRTSAFAWAALVAAAAFLPHGAPPLRAGEGQPSVRDAAIAIAEDDAKLRVFFGEMVARSAYRDILTASTAVLARRNDAVPAWEYRGFASQRLGQQGRAWESYERCIALDPENWWALTQLGRLQAQSERWDEAIASLTRAVEIRPQSADAHRKLLQVHRDRGHYEDAIATGERALAAGLDAFWVHAEIGYAHWAAQRPDASRKAYERAAARAKTLDHKAEAARGLAMAAFDERKPSFDVAPEELARRRAGGPDWEFHVGYVRVVTRVGPELPEELEAVLLERQRTHAAFFGLDGAWKADVTLRLARTFEEHEVLRKLKLPGTWRGRAFIDDSVRKPPPGSRRGRGRGGNGRRGGGDRQAGAKELPELRMHVAYAAPNLGASLSHELAHAVSRQMHNLPAPWLDEGLATLLQHDAPEIDADRLQRLRKKLALPAEARAAAGILKWSNIVRLPVSQFSGSTAWVRYAQAWSMVHFVLHRKGGRGRDDVRELLRQGNSWQMDRIAEVLDLEPEDVEREWRAYVAALSPPKPAPPSGSPGSSGR